MERKIRGFRRGVFQYDRPAVIVLQNGEETDCLTFRVQTGQTYEGSFLIANEQGTEIRGLIEQESRETELKLAETMFQGRQNTIRFSFLAEESFRLGRHKSMLSVVSDCGIRKIPVELQICRPFVRIENREVNDWKEFARLARTDWQTAASLFASEEFPRVFLYEQKEWIP